jgi:hypothetical protein
MKRTLTAPLASAPRTVHDDFESIDGYVVATFARYERVLVTLVPTLEEPHVADPDLALGRLRCLVETLAGFAIGAAVGPVARVARRGFGEEVRGRVALLLGRLFRADAPAVPVSEVDPPHFLRDPDRPLLDALGGRLLARLCRSVPQTRTCVAAIHAEVTRAVPARLLAFADALDRLAADDTPALAFFDQLASGWQHYGVALSDRRFGRPPEVKRAGNEQELWRVWTRRLGGRAAPDGLTRDEISEQGFLLQIA